MRVPTDANLPIYGGGDRFVKNLVFRLALWIRAVATQLNALSEGSIEAKTNARSAMPTSGTYKKGDFVANTNPTEQGSAGSKYYVDGWKRLTSGATHVLNTDWVEAHILTGN